MEKTIPFPCSKKNQLLKNKINVIFNNEQFNQIKRLKCIKHCLSI